MKQVIIYTDGGCDGNPGPGAWAAVLRSGEHKREISGAVPATTNNRMELMGALQAMRALNQPCEIKLHTDSQYVKKGMTEWLPGWKRNGWRTSSKEPVKNADLWRELEVEAARHKLHWHWVKGHAGNRDNERCDELATEAITKLKQSYTKAELKRELAKFKETTV